MIQNANEQVENSIKTSKMTMDSDVVSAKKTFAETYDNALQNKPDSTVSQKIIDLYVNINETSHYIDSLQFEINKLDDKDLQSSALIKKMFLNDQIGDTVFNKVKLAYSKAIDISKIDSTKSRLKKVQDTYTTETKNQFFKMNGPLGVSMILYGIQSELIKDGTKCLSEYTRK
jgi:hypothetical protein